MVKAGVPLRIVFFGTPDFAVPALDALQRSRHLVSGVVTQPDRGRGRGQRSHPGPVKLAADQHGLAVLQPEKLRDEGFLNALRSMAPDLGVVAAYGKILTDAVLQVPRLGLINVHASLLPKYRGAAPIHRAIMAGETETGVTIMRVVQALDAGPMFARRSRPIGPNETSAEVEHDLARIGAAALAETIEAISEGRSVETPQDDSQASYARKIEKADGIIDWDQSAVEIHNQIRGLHPWPHAFTELEGERTIVLSAEPERDSSTAPEKAGTIVEASADTLRVQTGRGILRVLVLQREGRRPVTAREFLAGRRVQPGSRFVRTAAMP